MNNDLISRSALKKQFENECLHYCYYCRLAKWDEIGDCYNCGLIDNAPAVEPQKEIVPVCKVNFDKDQLQEIVDKKIAEMIEQPQGEWIPVSERLPDKCGMYLVTEKVFAIDDRNHRGKFKVETEQVEFHDGKWNRAKFFEVIAWQALPKPYKKGDTE